MHAVLPGCLCLDEDGNMLLYVVIMIGDKHIMKPLVVLLIVYGDIHTLRLMESYFMKNGRLNLSRKGVKGSCI